MILETNRLEYSYSSGQTIHFPNLKIRVGDRVLVTGRSGCGKTTFLNLIAGALKIQKGEIDLIGNQFSSLRPAALDQIRADHIGYVFQTLNLIPFLTVLENVKLGVQFSHQRTSKASKIESEISRILSALGLPKNILNRQISNLSVGQQQRVACARALLGKPELFLADEPTSSLDPKSTTEFVQELINTFDPSKQAILIVSHNPSMVPFFDTVIELDY
ncbi:ATP-binding cassette domain-containing protein [Litorivicinus sp.]|nr:ATP-binding cassette domain-containing protein [Litorivicinus sp.]MDC1467011.1 ATP-binding cassette domain-containing protein [Litorivicinus sp.]